MAAAGLVASAGVAAIGGGCTTVDPGPNFVVSNQTFDADYFYCHVEPDVFVAKKCGPGDMGDNSNCHFNPSAVSGMALVDHPTIDCGGGDHPVDRTQVTSVAQGDLQAASLEMSREYLTAPIFDRPTDGSHTIHPRQIFMKGDPTVGGPEDVIRTWSQR